MPSKQHLALIPNEIIVKFRVSPHVRSLHYFLNAPDLTHGSERISDRKILSRIVYEITFYIPVTQRIAYNYYRRMKTYQLGQ